MLDCLSGRGDPVLQIAADGWWERALTLARPWDPARWEPLLASTGGRDDLAAEVLWPGPPIVFVGARYGGGDEMRRGLARLAAVRELAPASAVLALAGGELGPVTRVELGAVNAWRTVPPIHLGDATWRADLAARPDLADCARPVAVEVAHAREAWYAIEVSARRGDRHVVDPAAVEALRRAI